MNAPKHIGIVGISAEGAALCYKTIISESSKLLGANKHPEITLNNSSFASILEAQNNDDWETVAHIVHQSIIKLMSAGAEFAIIPANSVHFTIDAIQQKSSIPVLNLLELTAKECSEKGFRKVAVLGVGITMSKGLYDHVLEKSRIQPVIPTHDDQELINKIIYNELVSGDIQNHSTQKIIQIIEKLKDQGCDAVILGCTELPMVINEQNSPLPFIDTTRLLAKNALAYALK